MTARAGALDELVSSGALEDATGTSKDSITAELERLSNQSEVDATLEKLRAEVGGAAKPAVSAAPPPAVGAADSAGGSTSTEAVKPAKDADSRKRSRRGFERRIHHREVRGRPLVLF